MTDPISVKWKRNARGYYEYEITIPNAEDKKQLKAAMEISTELDKVVKAEIENAMKIKEARAKLKPKRAIAKGDKK